MARFIYADEDAEDYSIERQPYVTYVHIDRKGEEDAWGYCIDGIGCYWADSMEELKAEYDVKDVHYYYREQLQE